MHPSTAHLRKAWVWGCSLENCPFYTPGAWVVLRDAVLFPYPPPPEGGGPPFPLGLLKRSLVGALSELTRTHSPWRPPDLVAQNRPPGMNLYAWQKPVELRKEDNRQLASLVSLLTRELGYKGSKETLNGPGIPRHIPLNKEL